LNTLFNICPFLLGVYLFASTTAQAQFDKPLQTTNFIEIGGYASPSKRTPFWLQTNQFGIVPKESPATTLRLGLENTWKLSKNEHWKLGLGASAIGNYTEEMKVLLPVAHATLKYKNWELFVGRKKQWVGLADSTLGMGSYAWSGNALPTPRIQIGTQGFVEVPFTKGILHFNAFYSDGLMEKNRPVTKDIRLHQKQLYFRLGKADSKFKLYSGFNHQVQWGGSSPYFAGEHGKLPQNFDTYLRVITGRSGMEGDTFDIQNRVGNHLGSIDFAAEINTYEFNLLMYRQFVYEDGSLYYLAGIKDGLNGIRFKKKNQYHPNFNISEMVFEFLYTMDQGGPEFIDNIGKKRGRDNYFNNSQIRDGWGYYDRTVGTPFIPPTSATVSKFPPYSDFFTSNNRVIAYHLGLKGHLFGELEWYTKLSYSKNYGAYLAPFRENVTQFSGILGFQTKLNILNGILVRGAIAMDNGHLYDNSWGVNLALRKEGLFSRSATK
jgi:hypothetical protein